MHDKHDKPDVFPEETSVTGFICVQVHCDTEADCLVLLIDFHALMVVSECVCVCVSV